MKLVRAFLAVMFLVFATASMAGDNVTRHHHAVWVKKNALKPISMAEARTIVDTAHKSANSYGFDPVMLLAIMWVESGFRPKASNSYGAKGLMQVVPRFHEDKIGKKNILNIKTNIDVGTQVLSECFDNNNMYLKAAVRCYSGGASPKYLKKLRKIHVQIQRADLEMRFMKELPINRVTALTTGLTFEPIRRVAKTRVAML